MTKLLQTIKIIGFVKDKKMETPFFRLICHCQDCNSTWGMISRRKNKNYVVYDNSTSLASFISACQKAFDNVGLRNVLWQTRSSWFVSVNQRSLSWMCDSRSSPPTEKNIDKMQICESLSPKFPQLIVIWFLSYQLSLGQQLWYV